MPLVGAKDEYALMEKEGVDGTFGLQSYFMKRIQKMLAERGRTLAGWDEVSHGGGVEREGTLLMAFFRLAAPGELASVSIGSFMSFAAPVCSRIVVASFRTVA